MDKIALKLVPQDLARRAILLEERARQIAASDGRAEVNDLDREEARRQLNEPLSEREDPEDQIAEGDRPDAGVAPASLGKEM